MSRPLPTVLIASTQLLYHVSHSAYRGSALYFGCVNNRYDDPAGRFGTLYAGIDLSTALMESLFHDHEWGSGSRQIRHSQVRDRMVRELAVIDELTLLDLNAPGLMAARFGLNLQQLTSRDYAHTQAIAALAHEQAGIDGIVYPSRNNYPGNCLALFERAKHKLALVDDIALDRHHAWPAFAEHYALDILMV